MPKPDWSSLFVWTYSKSPQMCRVELGYRTYNERIWMKATTPPAVWHIGRSLDVAGKGPCTVAVLAFGDTLDAGKGIEHTAACMAIGGRLSVLEKIPRAASRLATGNFLDTGEKAECAA